MEIEQTHAEQNKYHYREVRKNPMYAMEGMMDVLRDELMMNMPLQFEQPEPIYQEVTNAKFYSQVDRVSLKHEKRISNLEDDFQEHFKSYSELLKEIDSLNRRLKVRRKSKYD